jgi:hypothetical protein
VRGPCALYGGGEVQRQGFVYWICHQRLLRSLSFGWRAAAENNLLSRAAKAAHTALTQRGVLPEGQLGAAVSAAALRCAYLTHPPTGALGVGSHRACVTYSDGKVANREI